jgi:hypothetical protein
MRLHQRIRRAKLQGEQLDITFPRRGRPSRFRRLERAGQMRLDLQRGTATSRITVTRQTELNACHEECLAITKVESPDAALDYLFPVGPMSEDQLAAEFDRLFPLE